MKTYWETFKTEGGHILDKLRDMLHEGNVRRVVIERRGRTVAEFPLTAGVVGAVFAPILAAVGVAVALFQDCTIKLEREQRAPEGRRTSGDGWTATSA